LDEEKFSNTLDQGIQLVNQEIDALLANGKKKIDITTKNVVDKAVSPVRPPLATPDEDSIYALVGVLPNKEAVSVAKESETP